MQKYPDGSIELDPDELIVAEIHELLMYGSDLSSIDAYVKVRGLDTPVQLRPSTPYIDDVFQDTDFRDWLMHRS